MPGVGGEAAPPPPGYKSGGAVLDPYQLQHSGKQTLPFARIAQMNQPCQLRCGWVSTEDVSFKVLSSFLICLMVALTRERCSLPLPTPHFNGWVRWESWSWNQWSRGDIPCSLCQLQHLRKQVPHLPWAKQYRQSCGWRYGWATLEAVNKGELSPLLICYDSKTDLQQLSLGEHTPHLTGATQWNNPVSIGVSEPVPKLWAWESCLPYTSVLCQHGCRAGELTSSPAYQSMPGGGRAGPVVKRGEELSVPPTSCNTLENRLCSSPEQHNIEPTLLTEVCVSQPQSCEHGRDTPTSETFIFKRL